MFQAKIFEHELGLGQHVQICLCFQIPKDLPAPMKRTASLSEKTNHPSGNL